jgi:hypothetical protein
MELINVKDKFTNFENKSSGQKLTIDNSLLAVLNKDSVEGYLNTFSSYNVIIEDLTSRQNKINNKYLEYEISQSKQ